MWHSGEGSAVARWQDDDILAAELADAVRDDELQRRVRLAAQEAFRMHGIVRREVERLDLDLLLLELVHDSATEPSLAGVRDRSGETSRTLVFEGDGLGVELEIGDTGIEGQLIPPRPGTVTLRTPEAEIATVVTDEVGCFRFSEQTDGPVRLECRDAGAATCATEWLTP